MDPRKELEELEELERLEAKARSKVVEPFTMEGGEAALRQTAAMNREFMKGTGRGLQHTGQMVGDLPRKMMPAPLAGVLGAAEKAFGIGGQPEWLERLLAPSYTPGSVTADKDLRFAGTTGEMFGAGLPFAGVGPVTPLSPTSPALPMLIAGGEYAGGDEGQAVAALIPLLASGGRTAVERYLHGKMTGGVDVAGRTAAFKKAGVDPVAEVVAPTQPMQAMAAWSEKTPGGEGIMRARNQRVSDQMEMAIKGTQRAELGVPAGPVATGIDLQKSVTKEGFRKSLAKAYDEAMEPIRKALGKDPIPLKNVEAKLAELSKPIDGLEDMAGVVKVKSPIIGELADLAKNRAAPYESVATFRRRIGEMLGDTDVAKTLNQQELSGLYGALSKDIRAAAASKSPALATRYDTANDVFSKGLERYKNLIKDVAEAESPERAFRSALSDVTYGPTKLKAIRNATDKKTWDSLSNTSITEMGLQTPGTTTDIARQWSSRTFLTNYVKLPDESQRILFSNPTVRNNLKEVAKVDAMLQEGKQYFRSPGSGKEAGLLAQGASIPTALAFMLTGHLAVGMSIIGGAYGVSKGAETIAKLMTSPKFTTWLVEGNKIPYQQLGSHAARLSKSADFETDVDLKNAMKMFSAQFVGPRRMYTEQQ